MNNDYHEYVIKDGEFVGEFETMYQECSDPWPESYSDMEKNPMVFSSIEYIKKMQIQKILSVGGGRGKYLSYLKSKLPKCDFTSIELSKTACDISRECYPNIEVVHGDALGVLESHVLEFDLIHFREIYWYILPDIQRINEILHAQHKDKYIIVELSFYRDQKYGNDYFDGVRDFLNKYPFKVDECGFIGNQNNLCEGFLSLKGKITMKDSTHDSN